MSQDEHNNLIGKDAPKWNRNPLHWLNRQLLNSTKIEPITKHHAKLFLEDIVTLAGKDKKQLILGQSIAIAYTQCVRLTHIVLNNEPLHPEAVTAGVQLRLWQDRLDKAMRNRVFAGMKRGESDTPRTTSMFTPPSPPKQANQQALATETESQASSA